jgi:hypothetical protein
MEKEYCVRRFILIAAFLCGASSCIFSDTVMIFLRDMTDNERSAKVSAPYFMALEDGIMDQFFEAEHIIFDSGLQYAGPEGPYAERKSLRMAREGGAEILIEIDMSYPPGPRDPSILPIDARFAVSDVASGKILHEATTAFSSIISAESGSKRSIEDFCFLWGRAIALEALQYLP